MTYPLSDGRVRVFIEDTLISNNFTDSSGMVSIVVPGGIYFLTISSPHDWIDSLWLIVPAGGVDLGTKSFLERFDEKEILLVYDTTYGWDRLQEIFDSIGVVYWEHFIPNFPQFIAAVAPSCLHVTEAVQFLNKHIEIVGADPGYYGCLDVKWKQVTLSLGLLTYVTTSVYLPSN
jgi:hypothetical protein